MSRAEISLSHGGERLKDIAEIYEAVSGSAQCLQSRIEALASVRDLGPPDLVYIVKSATHGSNGSGGGSSHGKTASKEVSSYHFVLGADTSSSASIAAYVNSLNYSLEASTGWFRSNPWKIVRSVYCSYDAFSGLDVRVEVRIPGGVTAYAVNASGNKVVTSNEMWQSLFVSAVLRSIHYASLHLSGLRRVDPLPTETMERRFLDAAKRVFWNGWHLGAAEGQPSANNVDNYLATGVFRFYAESQRPEAAAILFRELSSKDPQVNSLLAACLLRSDREAEAVKILHHSLTRTNPHLASLLALQVDLLLKKARHEEAVEVAKALVKAAPIDYLSWTMIARAQIRMGNYEAALLALNNCPITAQPPCDLDQLRSLGLGLGAGSNEKIWLPRLPDTPLDITVAPQNTEGVLERLKGATLRGPTAKAYKVLVELANSVGWDGLLQIRSNIFLMEEEYRAARQTSTLASPTTSPIAKNLSEMPETEPALSTSSELQDVPLDDAPPATSLSPSSSSPRTSPTQPKSASSFRRAVHEKRLCERWLDNLFMILFEDMRVYTIYRGELAHFASTNTPYSRSPREWLILGRLCRRLGHLEDAKEAYRQCVEAGFCWDAWLALLEMYVEEGRVGHAITAAVKLLQHEAGHFVTAMFPSQVGTCLLRLIRTQGAERIKITLVSLNLGAPFDSHIQKYLDYASTQKCMGHDY